MGTATENDPLEEIRAIKRLMERSSRYSNFSAASCIWAGAVCLSACIVQISLKSLTATTFLIIWTLALVTALGGDLLITRRRITNEDKAVILRLTHQMARAVAPALAAGLVLTVFDLLHGRTIEILPMWVLIYGVVISAAAAHAPRELAWLGRWFLLLGAVGMIVPNAGIAAAVLTFGIGHVVYGLVLATREGW